MELTDKPQALGWTCKLAVDGDGHPQCYGPNGSPPALDFLANAGKPGNWWGIATDSKGVPYVQKQGDPAPGFYVSTTALEDSGHPPQSQLRYVHSGNIPFIVLPSKPKFSDHQKLGDLVVCFNNDTGKSSWAIYADIGPSNQIGEGSIALNEALGLSGSCKTGGTDKEIIAMIYFPGSSLGWPVKPPLDPKTSAWKHFSDWGGYASAKELLPQINWDQFEKT